MLQKIIGQFTRDVRLYNDEKIQNLANRFPSENSPDGQRMIMYMLLFSWYTRNTILPFTADQIVSLVNSIIDVYYDPKYQQMNDMMISLIRNDLQRMSFWSNEYIFKTFFNDDFIKESNDQLYVNLQYLSTFNQWILQDRNNVEFYNYSHLLVQKCNKLQYVHNYTIMISDEVPQNVVQAHCPSCQTINRILKDDFLNMCRNYEKSYAKKFSEGISIYCHKCNSQINFIELYGNVKTLYGGMYKAVAPQQLTSDEKALLARQEGSIDCDKFDSNKVGEKIEERLTAIKNQEQATWDSLQTMFEQIGAVFQAQRQNKEPFTYQKAQKWYEDYTLEQIKQINEQDGNDNKIISNLNEYLKDNEQQQQEGLDIIFKYFIGQYLQHIDAFYYSGENFTNNIQKEIEIQFNQLDNIVRQELENLKTCLTRVQELLNSNANELTFISDGINNDKLINEEYKYKLLKLFLNDLNELNNNSFYQTIYFVSHNPIMFFRKNQQRQIINKFQPVQRKISRSSIQFISLCHGGIVIQVDESGESIVLSNMINAINELLGDYQGDVSTEMKKFVLFIAIASKYEKQYFDNYNKSKLSLRDDIYCFKDKNSNKSKSFYKTFMQLYYSMLVWNGDVKKDFKIDSNDGDKNIISDIQKVFITYYNYFKDKNLSFLLTLYTCNKYLNNLLTDKKLYDLNRSGENENTELCKCLIRWIQDFVKFILEKVYGYNNDQLLQYFSEDKYIEWIQQQEKQRKQRIEQRKQKIETRKDKSKNRFATIKQQQQNQNNNTQ